MKRTFFVILVITLFAVSVAMAGHHGHRSARIPKSPGVPMAPKAPDGFCGPEMGRHFLGAGKMLDFADEIGLTEQQIAGIKEKMEKNGLDRIDKQAELKKAKLKLRHLRLNDADDKDILSAIDRVGKLQTEMRKQKFIHQSEMKSILTEEQQDKLKEIRKEFRRDCRPEGRGPHGRGMGYNLDDDEVSNTYVLEPPQPSDKWEY